MQKSVSNTTAASTANRNLQRDGAHVDMGRAEVDLARGRIADAVQKIEPAHALLSSPDSFETLSAVLLAAGRTADAIAGYERLIKEQPFGLEAQESWFQAHLTLGGLYERQGRADEARKLYESLLQQWKAADANLPLLTALGARLAKLPAAAPR